MIVLSKDIRPGEHKIVSFLSQDVIVFRRQDNRVGVIDPISTDGIICCPFHSKQDHFLLAR